jgi:squalene-associated FAD-dependent desaturase
MSTSVRPHSAGERPDYDLIVVGAGWAGLAAAIEGCGNGARVALIDAAPQAGGRARRQVIDLGLGPLELDNGQHLLIGAYRQTIELIRRIGVDPDAVLKRERLQMCDTDGLHLRAARLPAPWHLAWGMLTSNGLSIRDRLALLRFMTRLRLERWQARPAETVSSMLARMRQPERLCSRLWEPLCISALNTHPEHACAHTFARVLKESLGGARSASDFLLPRTTLSGCLPDPALGWLGARGVAVQLRTPVRSIQRCSGPGWQVELKGRAITASRLILACGIASTRRLLETIPETVLSQAIADLDAFKHEPIATIWTAWPASRWRPTPSPIMFTWPARGARLADWLFDRGESRGHRIGAIVISLASESGAAFEPSEALARATAICAAQGLPAPSHARAVIEKRATFVCSAGRPVLHQADEGLLPGLWIAGDYTEADLPATLESAVQSGIRAGSRAVAFVDH